jgi:hypothetical protein
MSNKYVTAFETRIDVFYSGSAAGKVLKSLNKLGGKAVAEPGKFIVKGTEGPLLEGELEKASQWASQISHRFTSLVNKD